MNDAPRQKLREIIQRHGRAIVENPRRLENLLRDYCGEYRREISVLTMALEEHAVADLLSAASALPRRVALARLAQRLCDNLALSDGAARWAIESWAWALGLLSDAEFGASEIEKAARQSETKAAKNAPLQNAARTALAKQSSPTNQTAQRRQTTTAQTASVAAVNSVFVVAANGGGDYASIAEALQSVPANSRLLIREGLYRESIVLDKNVEIEGAGAVENIIVRSAQQSCVLMRAEQAAVRGVTLEGRGKSSGKSFFAVDVPFGELILENCAISSDTLSGVAIRGAGANPTLKNCRVSDGADAGIYVFDAARATIENCDVCRNANANIAITQGANPSVKNCRVYAGENGGVVVWGNAAAGVIEDCEIFDHRLSNVGVSDSADPIFRRCKIFGGRDSGVFVRQKGYGTFEECDVYANRKAEIAVTDESRTTLRGCTVRDGRESGIYVGNQASAFVESCNIYDNAAAGVSVYGESSAALRRCNIHRNGSVAVRVKENSRASVEDCDLRGNRIAAWETEHGVSVERKNNRE